MKIENHVVKRFVTHDTDHTTSIIEWLHMMIGSYVGGSRNLDGLEKTTNKSAVSADLRA
jgi:uncharacterized membrane protein